MAGVQITKPVKVRPEQLRLLIYWINERESIRLKKETGVMAPWTEDQIFQTYRFCNVRRRDDRVSRWLRTNVVTGENMRWMESFVQFTGFCRWNNWPPTIKAVMDAGLFPKRSLDWPAIVELVEERMQHGKTWTGAYMIKAPYTGEPKTEFVANIAKSLLTLMPLLETTRTRREVWEEMTKIKEWGSFMAGQVIDDWTWVPLLSGSKDLYTWAPQGPGSLRGLNRMLALPLETKHSMGFWCETLQEIRKDVVAVNKSYKDITLMDLQNCLCEFDKWSRVKLGEGRPRAKYSPETAF